MKLTVARAPHLRRTGLVITVATLGAIALATLMPVPGVAVGSHFCLVCGSLGGVDAVLNVFLFAPLGIGLALTGFPGKRAVIAMCALSALIETAQFFVIPGRYSTIGDVLTNTLGGALGFALGRYAFTLLRPSPRIALALSMGWSAVWLAIQTISAFGFSPAIPRSEYYGQIARRLGNFEQFQGAVVRASIADVRVPDTRFPDSHRVRELLLRGAIVTTTIVPATLTSDIAPIVRVADASQREIVLLAQSGEELVFGVRTGAAVLRLRPPLVALPDVFPAVSPGDSGLTTDTITVSARYSAREAWVNTQTRTSYDHPIPITASLGWTMLLPFQWFIEGTRIELVVSAIWIACLLLPIGYWGCGVARFPRAHGATRIRMTAVPLALVLLYVGLVVVPHTFGVTAAPPSDWLAALTGILLGGALAPRVSARNAKVVHTD
jgi:VanZ like family